MDTLGALGTIDEPVHRDLRLVDDLVRALGSTLDVDAIADRSLPVLRDALDFSGMRMVVVDEIARELRLVGNGANANQRLCWPLEADLADRLRQPATFVRVDDAHLPAVMRGRNAWVAFRLVDGDATVGLVLVPGNHVVESGDAREDLMVRTVGGLVGSIVGRALVHESLQRVTDRLDSARRLQQHVLDHVSHEFNTPLMILRSVNEFVDTDDAAERAGFLDMNRQALDRLEQLVQGILEVARSRVETSWHALRGSDLEGVVIDPVLDAQPWRRDVLSYHIDVDDAAELRIDVDGLELVLEHLLRNAWSFSVENGSQASLAVFLDRSLDEDELVDRMGRAVGEVRRRSPLGPVADRPGDRLVIEVADDGIGIPDDEQEIVFEPFAQARNSPLRGVSGAGMGLPVCRKRIRAMGGELRLRSTLGEGTLVRVEVPLVGTSEADS